MKYTNLKRIPSNVCFHFHSTRRNSLNNSSKKKKNTIQIYKSACLKRLLKLSKSNLLHIPIPPPPLALLFAFCSIVISLFFFFFLPTCNSIRTSQDSLVYSLILRKTNPSISLPNIIPSNRLSLSRALRPDYHVHCLYGDCQSCFS